MRLPTRDRRTPRLPRGSPWTSTSSTRNRRPPTEYLRNGRFYVSCEADEPLLPQALAYIGEDQVVYASDFPHWDHRFPKSIAELKGRPDLTDAQKRKVLADNARRLYRLT